MKNVSPNDFDVPCVYAAWLGWAESKSSAAKEMNASRNAYATFASNSAKTEVGKGFAILSPLEKPILIQTAQIKESMQFNRSAAISPSAVGTTIALKKIPIGDGLYGTVSFAQLYKTLDEGQYILFSHFTGASSTLSLSVGNSSGSRISFAMKLTTATHSGTVETAYSQTVGLFYSTKW